MDTLDRKQPKALIADTDEEFRIVLRKILEESGAVVEAAANGKQAIVLFEGLQPDIVFLQSTLPELDGFSTCERIRKLPNGESVPIILLAELDDGVTAPVAHAVGATECIVKPLDWLLLSCRIILALRTYCGVSDEQEGNAGREKHKSLRQFEWMPENHDEDAELIGVVMRLKEEMGKDVLTGMLYTMLDSVKKTVVS